MKKIMLFFICAPLVLFSQVNYQDHIQPILEAHCVTCHSPGKIGPMPLHNYESTAAFASMIGYVTTIDLMPPWRADQNYSDLKISKFLSADEKAAIKAWILAGLPEQKRVTQNVNQNPSCSSLSICTEETHLFKKIESKKKEEFLQKKYTVDQAYIHEGDYKAHQRVFVIPTALKKDIYIDQLEFQPGDPSIVLSATIALDTSNQGIILDQKDPKSGYANISSFGFRPAFPSWYHWSPDLISPSIFPFPKKIPAGSYFLIHIQYQPSALGSIDQSAFTINYQEKLPQKPILQSRAFIHSGLLSSPFKINKNSERSCRAIYEFTEAIELHGLMPYGQLICEGWEIFVQHKDQSITPLLKIDDWRMKWKRKFLLQHPVKVFPGDQLIAIAHYNNTEENIDIPILPTKEVREGEGLNSELFLVTVDFVKFN